MIDSTGQVRAMAWPAATKKRRRIVFDVWRLTGTELFGRAADNSRDAGSIKRSGAELEEKVGCLPTIDPRGLIVGVAHALRNNGVSNAQRRLAEAVLGIEICSMAGQEFDHVIQSLIGRSMKRGPAEFSGSIHVGAALDEESYGLKCRRPFFGRSWPGNIRTGPGRQHERRRAPRGGDRRIGTALHQHLDGIEVVYFRSQAKRGGALQHDAGRGDRGLFLDETDI